MWQRNSLNCRLLTRGDHGTFGGVQADDCRHERLLLELVQMMVAEERLLARVASLGYRSEQDIRVRTPFLRNENVTFMHFPSRVRSNRFPRMRCTRPFSVQVPFTKIVCFQSILKPITVFFFCELKIGVTRFKNQKSSLVFTRAKKPQFFEEKFQN